MGGGSGPSGDSESPAGRSSETLEWITDPRRFARIAAEWDQLAGRERSPFLMSCWIAAWCAAFAGPRHPQIAALWRGSTLAGGLPLLAGRRRWDAMANDHTPEFGLLAIDADARRRIAEEVLAQSKALNMQGLVGNGPTFETLVQAAGGRGRWTLIGPGNTSLVTATTGSFDEYRASLSSKVRSELGRLRRKSEREHDVSVSALAPPHDLDAQLTRAFALEASGWKGRAGTAITSAPETEQFYRQVAREFHASGALRISELTVDGTLAAMAISIVHRGRAFTVKVGYDERQRALGPGFVLLMAMIERCFELGLAAYEFSGPDAEYERRFATSHCAYRRLRIYRPGPLNAARYIHHRQVRPALRLGYHRTRKVIAALRPTT
jgi:CelD/BcsL family acetyltransferase involved in cellulose biosynthesis